MKPNEPPPPPSFLFPLTPDIPGVRACTWGWLPLFSWSQAMEAKGRLIRFDERCVRACSSMSPAMRQLGSCSSSLWCHLLNDEVRRSVGSTFNLLLAHLCTRVCACVIDASAALWHCATAVIEPQAVWSLSFRLTLCKEAFFKLKYDQRLSNPWISFLLKQFQTQKLLFFMF